MPLRLLAGEAASDRAIRWVHASELEDPTPWLKGGELILTTGMGVGDSAAKHRAYVRRLDEAGVGGPGFWVGVWVAATPQAPPRTAANTAVPALVGPP